MKRLGVTTVIIGAAIFATSLIAAWAQTRDGPETKGGTSGAADLPACPVGGQPINLAVRTATAEGPVFFCCDNCIKKYGADPKKYAEMVVAQRKALEKLPRIQVTCPISGEPVKTAVFVEERGTKVFFCCKNCRGKYEDDRAKYTPRLADTFTYQTKCPVTGKAIDPQISASAPAGETVFFCCKDCPEKFRKDPEKFAPKLEEQGFRLDLSRKKP